ncbi:hypothetical protein O6H91_06G084700 [Diphasiastrum complanatum]|uniref:Uncharacterized protein n=1 Tax=Diphasiastrum complanatum TaxID=34168 RepID=A0ACC2DG90_DIPCM|nr:hypothetical protein O6H91_06G084700 [Diphasiastrum complanatum]
MDVAPDSSCAASVLRLPIPPPLLTEEVALLPPYAMQTEVFAGEHVAAIAALSMQPSNLDTSALLPVLARSYTQQNQFSPVSTVMHQQVSTPTMHPNLVTTLKSIISPPCRMPLQSSGKVDELDFGDSVDTYSIQIPTQVSPALEVSQVRSVEMQPNEALGMYSFQEASCKSEEDQVQVAVVPLDLIQNRRPFKCANPTCSKTFKNPQTMKMHLKTHYAVESNCRFGPQSLTSSPSAFKAGHNKKIPSRCPVCKRTFVGLYELRRHFGRKHSEGEKRYACGKCGKKFYIEVDLRDHQKLCGEPIKCKCGMKFAFRCNLVAHKKARPECQDTSPSEEEQSTRSGTIKSSYGLNLRTLSNNSKPCLTMEASHSSPFFESATSTSIEALLSSVQEVYSGVKLVTEDPFSLCHLQSENSLELLSSSFKFSSAPSHMTLQPSYVTKAEAE